MMEPEEMLTKLQTMTIKEKLALLSDTDKAYLTGYLDRAIIDIKPRLRIPSPALPKRLQQDTLKGEARKNK